MESMQKWLKKSEIPAELLIYTIMLDYFFTNIFFPYIHHINMGCSTGKAETDKLIIKTVEEVMTNIFGKRAYGGILRILREKYSLEIDEVPEKPKIFSKALRRIIGVGSVIIEDLIIENVCLKLGLNASLASLNKNFEERVTEIRRRGYGVG